MGVFTGFGRLIRFFYETFRTTSSVPLGASSRYFRSLLPILYRLQSERPQPSVSNCLSGLP
jgi:hypothetical protein